MIDYLISKDSRNKIRVVYLYCSENWDDELEGYVITRTTGMLGGKLTSQPNIVISHGKAKRTCKEQLELQYNSEKKKYLDKGYKECPVDPTTVTTEVLDKILGEVKTGSNGEIKPMLAKSYKDIKTKNIFDKTYYESTKINGVRCLMYWNKGEIHTASRGSVNYDLATFHIINHPKLIAFFKENPNIILDGELYTAGETLNRISGVCRAQKTVAESEFINYYIYDIVDTQKSFKERLEILKSIQQFLDIPISDWQNPYINWKEDDLKCIIVPHHKITGWETIKKRHDEYVSKGWEGLVLREENSPYQPGMRNNNWIKVKEYIDAEYPIVGIEEGLRDEDMCFVCKTPNGYTFKVKPMGPRELKYEYLQNQDKLIGKMLTIKYFEMSGSGTDVPQQPIGIAIRDYE